MEKIGELSTMSLMSQIAREIRQKILADCLKTMTLIAFGLPSLVQAELLSVNANRWVRSDTDLTASSGGTIPTASSPVYGQNLWVSFSSITDAAWVEVVFPDGSTNAAVPAISPLLQNSVSFYLGADFFESPAALNAAIPSGYTYLLRFGGGTLGEREDTFLIPDDSQFFANPPSAKISPASLAQLADYEASRPAQFAGDAESFWIGDSGGNTVAIDVLPFTVPEDVLQPGISYIASSTSFGTSFSRNSFAGLTRSDTNEAIFEYFITSGEDFYFRTRPPHLRLTFQGQPAFNGSRTVMSLQLVSNPNYDADLEFTESLAATSFWSSVKTSFGASGTNNVTIEKPGDVRTKWNKSLFFRVKNQLTPVQATPNPPQATPI